MGARVRTTDDILKDLRKRAAAGEDVQQQQNSTIALALLRAELARMPADSVAAAALAQQIRLHESFVEEVADDAPPPPPTARAGKKAPDAV